MYTILILFIMVFIPLPFMRRTMVLSKNPYHGVLRGIFASVIGIMVIFIMVKLQTGMGISDMVGKTFHEVIQTQDPQAFSKMVGAANMTEKEFSRAMEEMVKLMQMIIPASIIVWASLIAYVDYMLLSVIATKCGLRVSKLPPIRSLTLPRSALLGAVVIYLLSYLSGLLGIIDETMLILNVQILLDFIFAIQGVAVIFYFGHMKRIPKVVIVLICIALFAFPIAKPIFFLLGLSEVAFQLRKRIKQKQS